MRDIDHIILHTAASAIMMENIGPVVVHQDIETVKDYHVNHNGWSDIGYHYYIGQDGAVYHGRPIVLPGAHARGANDHTIGICVSGHGDLADWNYEQKQGLAALCVELMDEYELNNEQLSGHREAERYGGPPVTKTCPGLKVDMEEIRELVFKTRLKGFGRTRDTQFIAAMPGEPTEIEMLRQDVNALKRTVNTLLEALEGKDLDPENGTTLFDLNEFVKG